jgi:RNA polymerase sigma-70 factor (ECF subfamily)
LNRVPDTFAIGVMIASMALDDRIARARTGDGQAFDALAAERVDRLYAVATLILRDAAMAQDAVQEALVRAWRDLPGLQDPSRFDAWLQRILVHSCYDEARRSRRGRAVVPGLVTELSGDDPAPSLADRDQIERGFRRLRPEHRAAIVLQFYLGLSTRETADALGVPEGTVKSRTHFATRAMRAALEADARPPQLRGQERDR